MLRTGRKRPGNSIELKIKKSCRRNRANSFTYFYTQLQMQWWRSSSRSTTGSYELCVFVSATFKRRINFYRNFIVNSGLVNKLWDWAVLVHCYKVVTKLSNRGIIIFVTIQVQCLTGWWRLKMEMVKRWRRRSRFLS